MFGDEIESRPIPIAKVKEILASVEEKNYEQRLTYEYASKFAKLSSEEAEQMLEELKNANIPRLKERHMVKLIDIMPLSIDEIRAVLLKENLTLSKEDLQKLLEIIKKYYKEKG